MAGAEATAVGVVLDTLVKAQKEGWLDKAKAWLRKRHKVLVLGSSGAGKSQLIKSFSEAFPETISHLNRTQFVEKNKIKISNELFEFVEAPGDLAKPELREKAIRDALKDEYILVVNIVSFGYHEYALTKFDTVFTKKKTVRASYLNEHREVEMELLDQWLSPLFFSGSKCKLITVVSKADVWWDSSDKVLKHYRIGEYAKTVGRFTNEHAVVPYSSQIQKVYGQGATARDFDESDKSRMRQELLRNILAAIETP